MWMFVSGIMCGATLGFVVCACLVASRRTEDCLNCHGLIEREADLRAVTKSRDHFKTRCEQLESLVHGLRSKNGALSQEVQRRAFLTQKEA